MHVSQGRAAKSAANDERGIAALFHGPEQPPALVLAIIQAQAAHLTVEERMALATEILGVEADHLAAKVRERQGAQASHIIVDEVASLTMDGKDLTPYVTKVEVAGDPPSRAILDDLYRHE